MFTRDLFRSLLPCRFHSTGVSGSPAFLNGSSNCSLTLGVDKGSVTLITLVALVKTQPATTLLPTSDGGERTGYVARRAAIETI
ncbi:hypothetical protein K443DRAFT_676106 [Laccaria amethystina LaAM-08-1]|uniref:Unplaced genomic scaffold K443scaffold_37, whole genome shotgun sequence n=1 Tax=Laccaria amethystina LaAM-08-1 TaxID=1095629 RepID=A0A0C9Y254_9AGAR|nr:hypothetical protein K443DRAFT_676106 [Laccaria amethystina LaAM-08-1]